MQYSPLDLKIENHFERINNPICMNTLNMLTNSTFWNPEEIKTLGIHFYHINICMGKTS